MEKKEKVDQTIYNDLIIYNIPFRSLFKEKGRGGLKREYREFLWAERGRRIKTHVSRIFQCCVHRIDLEPKRPVPSSLLNKHSGPVSRFSPLSCFVPLPRAPPEINGGRLSLASLFREAWQKSEELLRLSSIYIYIYEILLIRLLLLFRDERIWNTRIWYILINSKSVSDILFEFVQTNNIFFLYFHCVFIIIARKIFFKGRIRNSIIPS